MEESDCTVSRTPTSVFKALFWLLKQIDLYRLFGCKSKWEGDRQPDVALPLGFDFRKIELAEVGVRLSFGGLIKTQGFR